MVRGDKAKLIQLMLLLLMLVMGLAMVMMAEWRIKLAEDMEEEEDATDEDATDEDVMDEDVVTREKEEEEVSKGDLVKLLLELWEEEAHQSTHLRKILQI